jgi:hypothetical protein
MVMIDQEYFEIDGLEKKTDENKKIKFKKIYKLLRIITEDKLRGRTGES